MPDLMKVYVNGIIPIKSIPCVGHFHAIILSEMFNAFRMQIVPNNMIFVFPGENLEAECFESCLVRYRYGILSYN
jgi:hypothetical protein